MGRGSPVSLPTAAVSLISQAIIERAMVVSSAGPDPPSAQWRVKGVVSVPQMEPRPSLPRVTVKVRKRQEGAGESEKQG